MPSNYRPETGMVETLAERYAREAAEQEHFTQQDSKDENRDDVRSRGRQAVQH
jgi:hypothetical protein